MNYLNYIKKFQLPDGPIKGVDLNQSVLTQGSTFPSWGSSARLWLGQVFLDAKRVGKEAKDYIKEKAHTKDFLKI